MWYIVLHDTVPTNERLHVIRLVESDRCRQWEARLPRTPADGMQRRNGHLVEDKGKNCADASNGPAPHSRLVSAAPFPILATTVT